MALAISDIFAAKQSLRTPDERFAELPEFPYPAKYCEVDVGEGGQLRVAWVEDGPAEGNPVLMLQVSRRGRFFTAR